MTGGGRRPAGLGRPCRDDWTILTHLHGLATCLVGVSERYPDIARLVNLFDQAGALEGMPGARSILRRSGRMIAWILEVLA